LEKNALKIEGKEAANNAEMNKCFKKKSYRNSRKNRK
jgi:hypothetical protein